MPKVEAVLPSGWRRPSGYSHGLAVEGGREIHVAGQFGWDPETGKFGDGGFVAQWDRALENVAAVVKAAGGKGADIVTLRIYVLSIDDYRQGPMEQFGAAWIKHIGKWFPTVTMVQVSGLEAPEALVEIEAVARVDQ
jgi:enamine deaminase RidA (YjgF/YER057c/UK114 family)